MDERARVVDRVERAGGQNDTGQKDTGQTVETVGYFGLGPAGMRMGDPASWAASNEPAVK